MQALYVLSPQCRGYDADRLNCLFSAASLQSLATAAAEEAPASVSAASPLQQGQPAQPVDQQVESPGPATAHPESPAAVSAAPVPGRDDGAQSQDSAGSADLDDEAYLHQLAEHADGEPICRFFRRDVIQ